MNATTKEMNMTPNEHDFYLACCCGETPNPAKYKLTPERGLELRKKAYAVAVTFNRRRGPLVTDIARLVS